MVGAVIGSVLAALRIVSYGSRWCSHAPRLSREAVERGSEEGGVYSAIALAVFDLVVVVFANGRSWFGLGFVPPFLLFCVPDELIRRLPFFAFHRHRQALVGVNAGDGRVLNVLG